MTLRRHLFVHAEIIEFTQNSPSSSIPDISALTFVHLISAPSDLTEIVGPDPQTKRHQNNDDGKNHLCRVTHQAIFPRITDNVAASAIREPFGPCGILGTP